MTARRERRRPPLRVTEGRKRGQVAYAFGATLDQIDQLDRLLRTISAHSDMVAVCSGAQLDDASLSTLGESIFDSAREVRGLVDAIYAQRLRSPGTPSES
ncbi:hypothetical protein [Pseudoxanthomonas composti]|nr:hypothetical protein [Pseudoxanthomonas composti]